MKKLQLYYALVLFFIYLGVLGFSEVQAFHVAGAEMKYRCTGKNAKNENTYKFTLIMWYDCEKGNPSKATIDKNIEIYVFNAPRNKNDKYTRFTNFNVKLRDSFNVANKISAYACIANQPSICLDTAVYEFDLALPDREGGYALGWQRCCRNRAIVNLEAPTETGTTWLTLIPGYEKAICNSSAYFNKPPASFICWQKEFKYDYSATDPDGDSLSYRLFHPLDGMDKDGVGTSSGSPVLSVASGMGIPPMAQVKFRNNTSGYGPQSPFGTNDGGFFRVDAKTGMLTFLPPNKGLHVFAVAVDEWRKGKVINTNIRDFQIWVHECHPKPLPITIAVDSATKNLSLANDTIFVEEDVDFEFTYKISVPKEFEKQVFIDYKYEGLLTDSSIFSITVKKGNPTIINVKGKAPCDLTEVKELILFAIDSSDCVVKYSTFKKLYFKVLPIKIEQPVVKIDLSGNKLENPKRVIAESISDICFKATITNLKKDARPLSYKIVIPDIIDTNDIKIIENRQVDIITLNVCIKMRCEYINKPLKVIVRGIRTNRCNIKTFEDEYFEIVVRPPVNDPAILTFTDLAGRPKEGNVYIVEPDKDFCVNVQYKDKGAPSKLFYKYKLISDNKIDTLLQPKVREITNRIDLLEAEICWRVSCRDYDKVLQLIYEGYDSVLCTSPAVAAETLLVKFKPGPIPDPDIRFDYLKQKVDKDTVFFELDSEGCIDILVDDLINQGKLTLSLDGEVFKGAVKNVPVYSPTTGRTTLRTHFCWIPHCDDLNKPFLVKVNALTEPDCPFTAIGRNQFWIKAVNAINVPPQIAFADSMALVQKLSPGTEYCFKASVTDLNSGQQLTAYSVGQVFNADYFYGNQAKMTVTGTNPLEVQICFTPNCHIANGDYPIEFCAFDNPCVNPDTICAKAVLKIDDCQIQFPNIITPNNDGINDLFLPMTIAGIDKYKILIFDRWGNLCYENQTLEGWNGIHRITNAECSEGVYFYTVDFQFYSGTKLIAGKRTSSFTLVR